MKKVILKTALITFGITLILAISLFGIVSFCAPAAMMSFFESLGLENIGGDYAYQEYQNTQSLSYLAHAFELAADNGSNAIAEERFEELYGETGSERREQFGAFCEERNTEPIANGIPKYDYRAYLCGRAAVVKYRLALTDDDKTEVCVFALSETDAEVTEDSPMIALAVEAIDAPDAEFCSLLLEKIRGESKFDVRSEHYRNVVKFLEEAIHE